MTTQKQTTSVAEAYLQRLAAHGVEYLFANGGTDFAPLSEAVARAHLSGAKIPEPINVPHENVAVGMAYGYAQLTGRAQAVMVHVGPGTANAINNILNAYRHRVPIFFTAGRAPILETGPLGSRNNFINWAQELFDQAGMLRELVKWEYELRHPLQVATVVDRALAIASSEPQGPVYLSLPREVLAADAPDAVLAQPLSRTATVSPQADAAAIEEVAQSLLNARSPLIITADAGRTSAAFEALTALADRLSVPVVEYRPRFASIPTQHPMHAGWDAAPYLHDADVVLVVECDVPWIPAQVAPADNAKVVHIGLDPMFERYPIRGFRSDLSIRGELGDALRRIDSAAGEPDSDTKARIEARRAAFIAKRRPQRPVPAPPAMTAGWLSRCVNDIRDENTIILDEYPLMLEQLDHKAPGTYFSHSPAGGLGWATGAALGMKLASPQKTVIAAMGDGCYLFGNPTPAHMVSRMMELPVLWIIYNNRRWAAVHRATLSLYPDGAAATVNEPPFVSLEPSVEFEKIVEACGGKGFRVESPEELPGVLQQALHVMKVEKRQVLINYLADVSYARTS